jgi:hypothetical protein
MRLNSYYRGKLRADICEFIAKEYENSVFGKEFREVTEEVRQMIVTARGTIVPAGHMPILEAYKATENIEHFKLSKRINTENEEEDGVISHGFVIEYPYRVETGDFLFSPGIVVPLKYKDKVLKCFLDTTPNPVLNSVFGIVDRYRCEVLKIKGSYSHILETSTTMKSLVKKAPVFQQFVPKYIKDEVETALIEDVPVDDSLKTIQAFEQSITKE